MSDKVALVTGATRGIGRAIVERLLAHGRVVVACARDAEALKQLTLAHGQRVLPFAVDLAEEGAGEHAVDEALRMTGRLDELVCAAGIVRYAPVGEVQPGDLAAQLQVNFVAPYLMAQRASLHMRSRGGAVLFVTSTLAYRPAALTSAYAASKAALVAATRALALELAPSIRVNALAPGVVDTDMIRVPRGEHLSDEAARLRAVERTLEELTQLHPLGRLGHVDDVASAAHFLLDASWITGSVLTVDGGLSVR